MARYKVIRIGKPLSIEDLKKSNPPRGRKPNPRDEELRLLVNEVSVGPESQVIPWELGDQKVTTARMAANRIIKSMGAHVYVATHRDHPGTLLFSRQPLSARAHRKVDAAS